MNRSVSRFLVWGAGGHGKVVADVIRACGHTLAGFVDGDESKVGRKVDPGGGEVVIAEREFLEWVTSHGRIPENADGAALGIGDNRVRQRALLELEECHVPSLVHPSAVVSPSARIGRGTVVVAGAVVNAEAWIGNAVIVNSGAVLEHDCVVADGAHISPGAVLAGGAHVGERSWIGAGATVIQGVEIGTDVTVGAGAAVIRDVPHGSVVVGVPARPIDGV